MITMYTPMELETKVNEYLKEFSRDYSWGVRTYTWGLAIPRNSEDIDGAHILITMKLQHTDKEKRTWSDKIWL